MDPSNDDIQVKETEEIQEADADNLVTNIGMGQSDDMLAHLRGRETLSVDQVCKIYEWLILWVNPKPLSFLNITL